MSDLEVLRGIASIETPPSSGIVVFSLRARPISLQGSRKNQRELRNLVQEMTEPVRFLLSGELKLDIEWYVHEEDRWESAAAPDLDNIIKPLLDGLRGPDGIMIDDCQVQEVSCRWIEWTTHEQELRLEIRHHPDDYIRKADLIFVHVGRNLYLPLNTDSPPAAQLLCLEAWDRMASMRDEIEKLTGSWYDARYFMPVQRPFHGARLRSFTKVEAASLRRRLEDT